MPQILTAHDHSAINNYQDVIITGPSLLRKEGDILSINE